MNGTQFWEQRVRSVVAEHGLVIELDRFGGEYGEVDDRTIGQIADSMHDTYLEYLEYFEDCPDCAGKGYFWPEYARCDRCEGSGMVSRSGEDVP